MPEIMMIESEIKLLKSYISKCRKQHRRISMETVKWYAGHIYDIAEQKRRFDENLPIGRAGIDFIDYHGEREERKED